MKITVTQAHIDLLDSIAVDIDINEALQVATIANKVLEDAGVRIDSEDRVTKDDEAGIIFVRYSIDASFDQASQLFSELIKQLVEKDLEHSPWCLSFQGMFQ